MRVFFTWSVLVLLACHNDAEVNRPVQSSAAHPNTNSPLRPSTALPKDVSPGSTNTLAESMPAASGVLGEHRFVAKRGVFRRTVHGDSLEFWPSAELSGCKDELTGFEGGMYLEIKPAKARITWSVGQEITDPDIVAIYRNTDKSRASKKHIQLVVDSIDKSSMVVRGRLKVVAGDHTDYGGKFEARFCPDGVVPREQGGTIAGVRWGSPPRARDLPKTPASAEIGGMQAPIVHMVAGRLPGVDHSPLFLDLFTAKPPDPCALHIGSGAATPGFHFALGEHPKPGDVIEHHGTNNFRQAPTYAALVVRPRESDPFSGYNHGDAWIIIDKINRQKIRGRVYAAFHDPGKSMTVGSFVAKICADNEIR